MFGPGHGCPARASIGTSLASRDSKFLHGRATRRFCLMIKLDAGNVLLKPSQRKQLMTWLRRSLRLGDRLGDFVLKIKFHRVGKQYEVRADVHDSAGDFGCRSRQTHWRDAIRDLARKLVNRLHDQWVRRAVLA